MTKRNVGGSLLSSSAPHILLPIECPAGTLQVRVMKDLDTHMLFIRHDQGESMLAEHPNGYSCHVLAQRIAIGDIEKAMEQADYIQNCGGMARHPNAIAYHAANAKVSEVAS